MPQHRRLAFVVAVAALCAHGAIAAQSEMVIIKEAGAQGEKLYHRPGCPVVGDGKGVLAMARAEAESRGFKVHGDCDPARSQQLPDPAPTKPPAPLPERVFIDAETTHYHRRNCARLGKDPKAVAVTAVGKRWPCPTCRPPVPKRTTEPLVPRWRGSGPGGARPTVLDPPA